MSLDSSGGTGATTFGNNHNIIISVFVNSIETDIRISTLEGKTQNQTATSLTTTFNNSVTIQQVFYHPTD